MWISLLLLLAWLRVYERDDCDDGSIDRAFVAIDEGMHVWDVERRRFTRGFPLRERGVI